VKLVKSAQPTDFEERAAETEDSYQCSVRNHVLDIGTMKCLRYLLPLHITVKELFFHNAGMSHDTVDLDYNPLSDPTIFAKILALNMPARIVSLRGNGLGDAGASAVAEAIASNTWTLSLNLFDNQIGDRGGAEIFNKLRYNIMLKSLSLSKNKCGDESFVALLDTLTGFEMNEQIKAEFLEHKSQLTDLNKYITSGRKSKAKAGAFIHPNNEEVPLLESIFTVDEVEFIKGNSFLEIINLSNNMITNKAARSAMAILDMKPDRSPELRLSAALREMNLSRNAINEELGARLSMASRERIII